MYWYVFTFKWLGVMCPTAHMSRGGSSRSHWLLSCIPYEPPPVLQHMPTWIPPPPPHTATTLCEWSSHHCNACLHKTHPPPSAALCLPQTCLGHPVIRYAVPSCPLKQAQNVEAIGERTSLEILAAVAARVIGGIASRWEPRDHNLTPCMLHIAHSWTALFYITWV